MLNHSILHVLLLLPSGISFHATLLLALCTPITLPLSLSLGYIIMNFKKPETGNPNSQATAGQFLRSAVVNTKPKVTHSSLTSRLV